MKEYTDFEVAVKEIIKDMKRTPMPLVIISGGSCSGKTHFSNMFREEIKNMVVIHSLGLPYVINNEVTTIEMDNYFKEFYDPTLEKKNGVPIYDNPDSYLLDDFKRDIEILLNNKEINYPEFDIGQNKRVGISIVSPKDILLVEGLYAIWALRDIEYENTIKIYLQADCDIRLKRRTSRIIDDNNYPWLATKEYFLNEAEKRFNGYGISQKEDADYVVSCLA